MPTLRKVFSLRTAVVLCTLYSVLCSLFSKNTRNLKT